MKTLLAPSNHGRVVEFIHDRMQAKLDTEQTEALVREYFFILSQIVADNGFSDFAVKNFPVLSRDVTPAACAIWLIRLTIWQFTLLPWEQKILGKEKVTWE